MTDVNDQIPFFEDPSSSPTNVAMDELTDKNGRVLEIVVVDLDLVT